MVQRPVHEIRMGAIKAVIWQNAVQDGTQVRHNVVLQRLYRKEGEKHWETSDSFGRDDLLVVACVAQKAADWIFEQSKSQPAAETSSQSTTEAPTAAASG